MCIHHVTPKRSDLFTCKWYVKTTYINVEPHLKQTNALHISCSPWPRATIPFRTCIGILCVRIWTNIWAKKMMLSSASDISTGRSGDSTYLTRRRNVAPVRFVTEQKTLPTATRSPYWWWKWDWSKLCVSFCHVLDVEYSLIKSQWCPRM